MLFIYQKEQGSLQKQQRFVRKVLERVKAIPGDITTNKFGKFLNNEETGNENAFG